MVSCIVLSDTVYINFLLLWRGFLKFLKKFQRKFLGWKIPEWKTGKTPAAKKKAETKKRTKRRKKTTKTKRKKRKNRSLQ